MVDHNRILTDWAVHQYGKPKIPVLYFFSGADLYSMLGLFPRSPAYALVAGLPAGQMSCFLNATCAELATNRTHEWFAHIRVRSFGYSITRYMREYFEESTGILPAFIFILKLFGHSIASMETHFTGFTIRTNTSKLVCYENHFISSSSDLHHIMQNVLVSLPPKPWAVMFRSGEAAHGVARLPWFTNEVLSSSSIVLQDETGLRATAFDAHLHHHRHSQNSSTLQPRWYVRTYGHVHHYTGNDSTFNDDFHEFKRLYQMKHPQQLPFCYGYCGEFKSNGMLVLAQREDTIRLYNQTNDCP